MIKNIVFDLGGVLVDFKPEELLKHINFNEEEVELFKKIIFYGEEWKKYNSSIISFDEVKELLLNNYPEYKDKINYIFNNFDFSYILSPKLDTAEYLKELKSRGYNIYILSDLSEDSYPYNRSFEFFNYVDGGVYSFLVGSTKPNKKNYEELINKFKLKEVETVFIDDNKDNIDMANKLGIKGVKFTSLDDVKDSVNKLLNE